MAPCCCLASGLVNCPRSGQAGTGYRSHHRPRWCSSSLMWCCGWSMTCQGARWWIGTPDCWCTGRLPASCRHRVCTPPVSSPCRRSGGRTGCGGDTGGASWWNSPIGSDPESWAGLRVRGASGRCCTWWELVKSCRGKDYARQNHPILRWPKRSGPAKLWPRQFWVHRAVNSRPESAMLAMSPKYQRGI